MNLTSIWVSPFQYWTGDMTQGLIQSQHGRSGAGIPSDLGSPLLMTWDCSCRVSFSSSLSHVPATWRPLLKGASGTSHCDARMLLADWKPPHPETSLQDPARSKSRTPPGPEHKKGTKDIPSCKNPTAPGSPWQSQGASDDKAREEEDRKHCRQLSLQREQRPPRTWRQQLVSPQTVVSRAPPIPAGQDILAWESPALPKEAGKQFPGHSHSRKKQSQLQSYQEP